MKGKSMMKYLLAHRPKLLETLTYETDKNKLKEVLTKLWTEQKVADK
jgi:hypothetical protein